MLIAGALIPAMAALVYTANASYLPDLDYWFMLKEMIVDGHLRLSLDSLLARSNEHIVLIPKLIYLANIQLTHGSNAGLVFFTWLMALLQLIICSSVLRRCFQQGTVLLFVSTFIVSMFIYTSAAAHNWMLGMSGVAWITANLFALAAFYSFQRYVSSRSGFFVFCSVGFALLGVFTYSTSLAILPMLFVGSILVHAKRSVSLTYLISASVVTGVYFQTMPEILHHPEATGSLTAKGIYFLAYLGGIFSTSVEWAIIWGALGLTLLTSLVWNFITSERRTQMTKKNAFWLCILVYSASSGLMAAASRSGFGLESALASRYATLPALFWAALIVLLILLIREQRIIVQRILAVALSIPLVIGAAGMHAVGYGKTISVLDRERNKPLAAISLVTGAYDMKLLNSSVTREPESTLIPILSTLKELEHFPYASPFVDCPTVGSEMGEVVGRASGYFDRLTDKGAHAIFVDGWVSTNVSGFNCVVLVNQVGEVRGLASVGYLRPDVYERVPGAGERAGWKGYVKPKHGDSSYQAYLVAPASADWLIVGQPKRLDRVAGADGH